jgi:hypothetical protein
MICGSRCLPHVPPRAVPGDIGYGRYDAGRVAGVCVSERSSAGPVWRLKLRAQLIRPT